MSLLLSLSLLAAGVVLIIALTSWLKIHSFLALFLVSLLLACIVMPVAEVVPLLKKGFGDTMGSIGLIIIFGTVIGVMLDHTGATVSMANFFLGHFGTHRSPVAISLTGFITGLPIFCDSGFIVLSGLNRSLAVKSGHGAAFMTTVLACSLYSVHCLIPPHPGATAAAGIMGANLGKLILLGILVAIPATVASFAWAKLLTRKRIQPSPVIASEIPAMPENGDLPAAWKSFLPIVVPLILITARAFTSVLIPHTSPKLAMVTGFLGEPVIALLIGMFLTLLLLPSVRLKTVNRLLAVSVEKAGPIIIIIASGGIFGAVIKATGVGEQAGAWLSDTGLGLLIPFLITAVLKTAQGSSTVAIITAASILAPMAEGLGFGSETGRLLMMLSMGAGSMLISHANDAYFWVITNFSGIDSSDTLKVYSTATIIMGMVSMAGVYAVSLFLT